MTDVLFEVDEEKKGGYMKGGEYLSNGWLNSENY